MDKSHASPQELAFRLRLSALLADFNCPLPEALISALQDHLYRVDAQGYSLCWDGPERERLMADLNPILHSYTGETL